MSTTHAATDENGAGELHPQGDGAHALKEVLAGIERDLILAALQESHGNKAKAARALGITERFMGLRVKRLGIDWRRLRPRRKKSA
jgi:transcriptional regulator with GAF, ATPase, and Fis domain